ncbi:MAG: ribosome biogenesis GTPase Der [Deltaproteobacteria bacterium]|nr:ribosome biogenesis GTPase Der [Deltaproteobacteria bacterium]MCL5276259.1 ribosome biogenesis GTPase Der [Deltaproteobacteria bacterium]
MNPLVAIVGRPNVGKSRLFNRIASKKRSIVLDLQGTTRDAIYETVEWERTEFDIVDTGGLTDERNNIHERINRRVEAVVAQATVVIMVCDYTAGVTPYDLDISRWLRKLDRHVLLAVNKIDSPAVLSDVGEFHQLGFGDVFGASAEHGYGVDRIMDAVADYVRAHHATPAHGDGGTAPPLRLVFAGKPNTGKSSMINYLMGSDIMIVDDQPGTTRDPVTFQIEINKRSMLLIDTAGLKKRAGGSRIEAMAGMKSEDMINRADIVVLMVDASAGATGHDKRLVDMVQSRGKGCAIAMNKWDLVADRDRRRLIGETSRTFGFVPYIPVVPTSAVTGQGVKKLMDEVVRISDAYAHRVPTPELNKFFGRLLGEHQPVSSDGKLIRLYYLVQVAVRPPVFVIFTNSVKGIKENYSRFIVSRIRDVFGFTGVPVKVIFRSKR